MYLKSNPSINQNVFKSQKSVYMPENFAGDPLDVSIDYLHGGYDRNLDMFLKLKKEIDAVNVKYPNNRKTVTAVVGSRPNVPAYVAGAPKTMYRITRAVEKKCINIYMNVTYAAGVTEAQIQYRGIITLNLIRILEQNDYIVNFRLFEISMVREEVFICEVVLKKPGDKLDYRRCYYPMCGKGFVRRVLARIKESIPFTANWGFSYGTVLNEEKARTLMNISDNDIYYVLSHYFGEPV